MYLNSSQSKINELADLKIKAWMIWLLGLGIALAISQFVQDSLLAGSVIGSYVLYGGMILGLYYLIRMAWSKRQKKRLVNQ